MFALSIAFELIPLFGLAGGQEEARYVECLSQPDSLKSIESPLQSVSEVLIERIEWTCLLSRDQRRKIDVLVTKVIRCQSENVTEYSEGLKCLLDPAWEADDREFDKKIDRVTALTRQLTKRPRAVFETDLKFQKGLGKVHSTSQYERLNALDPQDRNFELKAYVSETLGSLSEVIRFREDQGKRLRAILVERIEEMFPQLDFDRIPSVVRTQCCRVPESLLSKVLDETQIQLWMSETHHIIRANSQKPRTTLRMLGR